MRHLLLILFLFLCYNTSFSQFTYTKFWVGFTDKQGTPYTVDNPSEFLSQRAIERRQRYQIAIVENDLPVSPVYVDSLRAVGARILNTSKWLNGVTIELDSPLTIAPFEQLGFVREVDSIFRTGSGKREMIGKFNHEFHPLPFELDAEAYGASFNQINMLRGDYLHRLGYMGQDMVIAVMDVGFNGVDQVEVFAKMRDEGRLLGTWDYVHGEANVFDDGSHGTNVLATMAGYHPGALIGTAPLANYWLFTTEDGSSEFLIEEYNWVSAAEFADSAGADVTTTSLGYTQFQDPGMNHTYADLDGNTAPMTIAADIAASKGMLVVNSAGNEGNGSWHFISVPADGDSVLAVGAVDAEGNPAGFSSFGPTADGQIKPNIVAQGVATVLANTAGDIVTSSGTSFSGPVIAGMTTCLWQANREYSNWQIIQAVQQSASRADNPDNKLGYGIPNYYNAHLFLEEENEDLFDIYNLPVVYPNPFTGSEELSIMLYTAKDDEYELLLFDLKGSKVSEQTLSLQQGNYNKIYLPGTHQLPQGAYVLHIRSDEVNHKFKVMKL